MLSEELSDKIKALGFTIEKCGSQVTCNPPPQGSDTDYLVFQTQFNVATGPISEIVTLLGDEAWVWEGSSEHYQELAANTFMSWRKGNVNLIVTANLDFATKHKVATALCARLNLMNKLDRIALFQAVLYAKTWTGG